MPKRIELKPLLPIYLRGVVVPYQGPRGRMWLAVGDSDENGPLESEDEVAKAAFDWQARRRKLDGRAISADDVSKSNSNALEKGADPA